jgi:small multidrug resistance family-3 protein
MRSLLIYALAAIAEIGGCFAFWAWLKLGKSPLWALPGAVSLVIFAVLLTRIDSAAAGRAYAAYGGVYILASMVWMRMVEDAKPDRWDLAGLCLCLAGAAIILWAPRSA